MGDRLQANQQLAVNDALQANNGKVRLVMQGDGNLVLYRNDNGQALWASNTCQQPVNHAIMQGDGNFVCYDGGGKAYWASGTWGHDGAYVVLQDDGNVVVYQGNVQPNPNGTGALWASNTVQTWGQPGLPLPADSGDVHVDTGDWMHSWASVNSSGVISGKTHIWCTVALRGFTGSVCPVLFNAAGMAIWPTTPEGAKHQYGVDGSAIFFGTHDRTVTWQNQVDAATLAQAAKLGFIQWHDPKNRLLTDVPIAMQTIEDIIKSAQVIYDIVLVLTA